MESLEGSVRPEKVQEAIFNDDKEALSKMGRAGNAKKAEYAADRRETNAKSDDVFEKKTNQKKVQEALQKARAYSERDGDILPPEPSTVGELEDLKNELDEIH